MLVSLEVYNRKIKCSERECRSEEHCDPTKKKINSIFFSTILYLFNGLFFLIFLLKPHYFVIKIIFLLDDILLSFP